MIKLIIFGKFLFLYLGTEEEKAGVLQYDTLVCLFVCFLFTHSWHNGLFTDHFIYTNT